MRPVWYLLAALLGACSTLFGLRYSVKPGDDLASIARAHGVAEQELRRVNRLEPGDRVRSGDILFLPPGAAPTPAPSAVPAAPTAPTAPAEQRPPARELPKDQARQERVAPAVPLPKDRPTAKQQKPPFEWPVAGEILRAFGAGPAGESRGVDIGVPAGTPVRAAANGKVIYAGIPARAYGPVLILEHEGGLHTVYSNLREIHVSRGGTIAARQIVGLSGEKAATALPHVHFEVRRNGEPVDPLLFLPPH